MQFLRQSALTLFSLLVILAGVALVSLVTHSAPVDFKPLVIVGSITFILGVLSFIQKTSK